MFRYRFICVVVAVLASAWFLSPRLFSLPAAGMTVDEGGATQPQLQIVTYSSGLTGFFDTSTNKLYVYASDLKTPFMTVQLEKLGEPLTVITAPPQKE